MTATSKPLDLAQFEGHTPGPWAIVQDGNPRQNPYWYAVELHAGPLLVGRVECTNAQREKGEHTARLIAAAPALLAECRRQREEISSMADTIADQAVTMVRQREQIKALLRLCEKALTRSAIVHPGFADEIRAALASTEGK